MGGKTPAWQRRPDETAAAYAAFCAYYLLPAQERSLDAAWRGATKEQQKGNGKRAPGRWTKWSTDFEWVKRAAAYDEHLAEQDRLEWERRRKRLRDADWEDGQSVRDLIRQALPEASRFIKRKEVFVKGEKGQPNQLIITESFDLAGLVRALAGADKLQRLAADEPTDHIQLTGAALDAYIAGQLARLAHGGETSPGAAPEPDEADTDAGADADHGTM